MSAHRLPLGGTGWWVWRDVLVRSAGFPADGLFRFAAPEAASAADDLLAGDGEPEHFEKVFAAAVAESAEQANRLAADPLLREAVTWQNHGVLTALDGLAADAGRGGSRRNVRRRDREKALLRYWQRYCGKNETIGFFGPVLWAALDDGDVLLSAVPGPGLVRARRVWFESWALRALGDRLAADPAIRQWFPPALQPHLTLDGRQVLRPVRPPLPVSAVEAAALAACDGVRPARQVVEALVAGPGLGLRTAGDGYLLLDRLVERELITWDAGLPDGQDAEAVLRRRLAAIGDPDARRPATGSLDLLVAARDAVAAAAGNPEALRAALAALDAGFTGLTGRPASRAAGRAYAGRTVCYEDATRDLDVTLGTRLLDGLAEPLAVLL
ncbi:MAG TPA: lantibiotic dehydratase, partial [Pseudonocardiaceae bacterium]|nr:lantibiotic dehydratase [Pseudonocardiaceae bacterium]